MTLKPVVLCILDGVGYRSGPGSEVGNAVVAAEPAFYDSLFERYPFTTLEAGGLQVGLPEGQMGNSEVGHLTIGAGRVMDQELVRISKSLDSGEFAGLEMEALESLSVRAFSADTGFVSAEGRLLIELPPAVSAD